MVSGYVCSLTWAVASRDVTKEPWKLGDISRPVTSGVHRLEIRMSMVRSCSRPPPQLHLQRDHAAGNGKKGGSRFAYS